MRMSSITKGRRISAVLLDITGVLYESSAGGGREIPGSVGAVERCSVV